jgi:hypothetical protein
MRSALAISAQFAAFVWFRRHNPAASDRSAMRFAQRHWKFFLPLANRGLGRLLKRIANGQPSRRRQAAGLACTGH